MKKSNSHQRLFQSTDLNNFWVFFWVVFLVSLCLALYPRSAPAVLGDQKTSADEFKQTHASRSHGLIRSLKAGAQPEIYQIYETISEGQTIREYVDMNGIVFAVTWRGMVEPDLSILLGSYYNESQKIQPSPTVGRAPKIAGNDKIVIQKAGHMRDVRGRAYLPDLLPAHVNPGDLP